MKMTESHPDSLFLGSSDDLSSHFIEALAARFHRIVGSSGRAVDVSFSTTQYVIPGATITVADGLFSVPVWIGANGGRIFFILRVASNTENCKSVFHFSFGGAAKVGWSFLYEPVSGTETSVWGTVETGQVFVEKGSDGKNHLTAEGAFWVNDIAMMMQSSFRTMQREGISASPELPEPL